MKNLNEYSRLHKSFKEVIDKMLKFDDKYKDIDIDRLWTISKITLNNNEKYLLNLVKGSILDDLVEAELQRKFLLLSQ